jgi:hypothetical protein
MYAGDISHIISVSVTWTCLQWCVFVPSGTEYNIKGRANLDKLKDGVGFRKSKSSQRVRGVLGRGLCIILMPGIEASSKLF